MLEQLEMPLPLSKDEERELLAVLRDDRIARDTLIERNIRLVPMMIHRYFRNTTWEEEDLFGIGTIGLVKAIDSYKVGSGISLSTYAATCIRNEILKSLRKEKRRRLQIDALIAEDENGNCVYLWDTFFSEDIDTYSQIEREELIITVHRCIESLGERDSTLIKHRFGIGTGTILTQKEVAEVIGCSKSNVGRLEKKIMARLKDMLTDEYSD